MPADFNDQVLTGSKVLSATTYAEDEILMPNCPEGTLPGILLLEVEMENAAGKELNAANDYFRVHLSPKKQDANLSLGDPDAICIIDYGTAGVAVEAYDCIKRYEFPAPMLVSYKKIIIGFKATLAQTVNYRIHWVPRYSIEAKEISSLLNISAPAGQLSLTNPILIGLFF